MPEQSEADQEIRVTLTFTLKGANRMAWKDREGNPLARLGDKRLCFGGFRGRLDESLSRPDGEVEHRITVIDCWIEGVEE